MEKIPNQNTPPTEDTNFHEISEERKALREALRELRVKVGKGKTGGKSPRDRIVERNYKEPLDDLNKKASHFNIKELGGLSEAKEFLKKQRAEYEAEMLHNHSAVDYDSILEETPEIDGVKKIMEDVAGLKDFRMRRMLETLNPKTSQVAKKRNEGVLKTIREEIEAGETELEEADPIVLRQAELVENKEELGRSGHICITESTERDLEAIGNRMLTGKPMFLHGPTGTGKTSLARYAARHFTGQDPEMVFCSPQTRESNVWGKTGIRPTEGGAIETVEIYGPLAKAMVEGRVVIFDEFTALPKEQMVFIKGVFNAKVGDRINIVGNGIVEIKPGFQMIFTANLKSEKNPERQELPPEITREFEQNNLEVKYTPPDEAYDIMLARLMNRDGSLDMSYYDLNTTLPNLCKVMSEIQESYTNQTNTDVARRSGALDASGKVYSLKKFVMTQGSVEAILSSWLVERQTGNKTRSFSEFLDERFKTALTFKEYSKEDRVLVAKILASRGFLLTLTAKELDLPEDVFELNTIRQMRGEEGIEGLKNKSGKVNHLSLKEVAELDPFEKRLKNLKDEAEDLLGDEEGGGDRFLSGLDKKTKKLFGKEKKDTLEDPTVFNTFLLETYKGWGVEQDKLDTLNFSPELVLPQDLGYTAKKADIDESKYGEYTLNPDTLSLDYDSIPQDKIKILTLPDTLNNQSLDQVANYILQTYPNYHIPGLEYCKYIIQNPTKAPQALKDGNWHFFFGSLFRPSGGHWFVPAARWDGFSFYRGGFWLVNGWYSACRVVALEP